MSVVYVCVCVCGKLTDADSGQEACGDIGRKAVRKCWLQDVVWESERDHSQCGRIHYPYCTPEQQEAEDYNINTTCTSHHYLFFLHTNVLFVTPCIPNLGFFNQFVYANINSTPRDIAFFIFRTRGTNVKNKHQLFPLNNFTFEF